MEALILYLILFFPGISIPGIYIPDFTAHVINTAESIPFSVASSLNRTISYTLPALALLWYIILGKKSLSAIKPEKPCRQDVFSLAIGLPGLIVIALVISLIISYLSGNYGIAMPPGMEAPVNVVGWCVMVILCLGTGYLEETYFRFYLLTRLENYNLPSKVILSTMLFAFCHVHDGAFSVLNALLAGLLLSLLFIRYRSLHGIALAHGFYNIFVFTMGAF